MLNDFQIVMLASGSKGNAALISTAKQRFLVDIGISCRALTTRMKEIGISVNELDGVFITHEHVDHVRGLATFLKNYQVPVYSSALTWRAILAKDSSLVRQNCRLIDNNPDKNIGRFFPDTLVHLYPLLILNLRLPAADCLLLPCSGQPQRL